jgi:hypothetical protein
VARSSASNWPTPSIAINTNTNKAQTFIRHHHDQHQVKHERGGRSRQGVIEYKVVVDEYGDDEYKDLRVGSLSRSPA